MEDLKDLTLQQLFELLNQETVKHSNYFRTGATQDQFEQSQDLLKRIQAEIKFRKSYRGPLTFSSSKLSGEQL